MKAKTTHNGPRLSNRAVYIGSEHLRNSVKVSATPKPSCSYTFTKAFTGLYTGISRKVTTAASLPCRPAEAPRPKAASAGAEQSMRCKYLLGEKPTVVSGESASSTGFTAATASPTTPEEPSPSGPDVVVLDESPTFHDPADVDDVDGKRIPLSEALRNEIPPCRHCFPGWSR